MSVLPAGVYVHHMHSVPKEVKGTFDSLEWEVRVAVRCQMGAGPF